MPHDHLQDPVVKLDAALLGRDQTTDAAKVEAIVLNQESQLFADDHLIAHRQSVQRRLNRPHKRREKLIAPDQPWEGHACVYGCVVDDEDGLRMYYKGQVHAPVTFDVYRKANGRGKYPVCLARSDDGVHFEKRHEPGAAVADTNIVIDDQIDDFTILRDPDETNPAHRYKMLSSRGNWWAGLTPASSPDGIRWQWHRENDVTNLGDRMSYSYDPVNRRHVAWSRCYPLVDGRVVVQKTTGDFFQ